jgi:23S rRNA pseudouridine2605 synthase
MRVPVGRVGRVSRVGQVGRTSPITGRVEGGTKGSVSLERALSKLGLASRTEARALIEAGRVSVDGRTIRDPKHAVVPERAAIAIDGKPRRRSQFLTILLHKPRGVMTTRSDPEGRPTVYSLLTDVGTHVVPVGRLDLASSGLLLLTNDTQLAHWLTDPASAIPRVYLVTVRGRATPETAQRLIDGVTVDGEHLSATDAHVRKASSRESHLVITLAEGRNREIRRLLGAVGHPITRLRRVQFGGLSLGTLSPGRWRELGAEELDRAFPGRPQRPRPT